jgi:hypothetical protein
MVATIQSKTFCLVYGILNVSVKTTILHVSTLLGHHQAIITRICHSLLDCLRRTDMDRISDLYIFSPSVCFIILIVKF